MTKLTYPFNEKIKTTAPEIIEKLGNKGAQLYNMTQLGLPVPPGFTISTDVCQHFFENDGNLPPGLLDEIRQNIRQVEGKTGAKLGDTERDPLLVSARSGAAVSMPGMMETILNVGLTDSCVENYISRHKQIEDKVTAERSTVFILDCQRRLYEMFGENVFGIEKKEFRELSDQLKKESGVQSELQLSSGQMRELVRKYKQLFQKHGNELPQDPYLQLEEAIKAVEESAMGKTARNYRKGEGLPENVYTAVNVQAMVYGNKNEKSCSGVGFTRNRQTGIKDRENPYGEFVFGQGEDVVGGGGKNVLKLAELKDSMPRVFEQLMDVCALLEQKTGRVQDYEFTVEDGKLWMLQTRNGKLTGRANIRSSYDMAKEGLCTVKDAVMRVGAKDIEQLLHPMIDYEAINDVEDVLLNRSQGTGASPGGGVGRAVFDKETAIEYAARGEKVVLCRIETNPSDYAGMIVAQAIATSRGGETSHAALVAGNKGIPCVVGTGIEIDEENKRIIYSTDDGQKKVINEGDWLSVDGSTGKVLSHKAELSEPRIDDPDLQNFLTLLKENTKVRVYANANDAQEAKRALLFGAEGIGLARTEYMFLEDKMENEHRALTIQSWVVAEDDAVKEQALHKLEEMQKRDFLEMYKVMQDKPIVIRLLDYPLHELLGDAEENMDTLTGISRLSTGELKNKVQSYKEVNPMLGHRSVRLGITNPSLFRMQIRAILSAARKYNEDCQGIDDKYVTPHIEIPLVSLPEEVKFVAKLAEKEAARLNFQRGGSSSASDNRYLLGIMYETSAACLQSEQLARVSDFGSFGTNDLTQTTKGISREDGADSFLPEYIRQGILKKDPFGTINAEGAVAKAMHIGVSSARGVRSDYEFGICGRHAGDPDSLKVCYKLGLDNVSPGPNQVPIAWLILAQESLK